MSLIEASWWPLNFKFCVNSRLLSHIYAKYCRSFHKLAQSINHYNAIYIRLRLATDKSAKITSTF